MNKSQYGKTDNMSLPKINNSKIKDLKDTEVGEISNNELKK
jgi:hypothetical protein